MTDRAELCQEWSEESAVGYLKHQGFELRADKSWRPPRALEERTLNRQERRAIEYLVVAQHSGGLLTDRQHAQRVENDRLGS